PISDDSLRALRSPSSITIVGKRREGRPSSSLAVEVVVADLAGAAVEVLDALLTVAVHAVGRARAAVSVAPALAAAVALAEGLVARAVRVLDALGAVARGVTEGSPVG